MQKGKGSTASPPAGAGRGQPPSQRGPTPPNRGQDDYSSRNSQGYQQQGGIPMMFQGMMQQNPQHGQPPRGMPPYLPTRSVRISHQQTPNHQIYPSPSPPVGVRSIYPMSGSGTPSPFGMSPQYAQVDFQTVPVANQQVQFRGPGQQVPGPYNQVYPGYSTSASMAPSICGPPVMFMRNAPIPQNMPGPQPSFQPSRQEQQPAPPRKRNIIQIKDPAQDNKDVTEEILSQPASTITSDSGSPSLASETRISGNSSALNMPPQDVSKNNESGPVTTARGAVTITDPNDSVKKTKPTITQVATPTQTAKSTSPKTMHPDVKIIAIKNTRTVDKDAKKEENKVDVAKPLVKTAGEDVNQVKKASDTAASATTVVDGAKVSTEAKEKDSAEVKTENQINSNTAKPSISNEIVPPSAPVDSKVTTQEKEDVTTDIAPSKKLESKPKEKLGLESQEQTKAHNENLPNGSISPLTVSKEIIKENTQEPEMVPSVKDVPNSDIKVLKQEEISKVEAETVDVAAVPSREPTQEDEAVNGVESESKAKQTAVPTSATSELAMKEQPKRKKMNKRLKEMDKKPDKADLMDAFTEAPPKEEVKEEPKEALKETTKEEQEEKAGSEEETWEDKDEKSEEGLWSPEEEAEESKNGPRFYDRDFLLQFQFNPICTEKPDDLPDIEVVLQNPVIHRPQLKQPYPRLGGGGGVDFMMPSYMRPQRGQGQSNQSMTRSNKGRMPAKKVIHTSIEQKVEVMNTNLFIIAGNKPNI
uniref:Eukaryotic translation initiation factor 4 gamma 1-like isoform X1 n=1 Tax=Actinia tenebrosa TaxID=6105 RepID=A0A6P8HN22_ACTTE